MSESPQPSQINPESTPTPTDALARRSSFPAIVPATIDPAGKNLLFAPRAAPAEPPARRFPDGAKPDNKPQSQILRGLKDLQQLQKQTLAVLEAVKGSLDDIQQVLRSPEATRGLEKQKNAATLLAKGFARDAVEQAAGAAQLLPANPEAHLLLALSLAADQQLESALAATRKGLALVDRRTHPLAIEAGLLHTLAALGNVSDALDRWSAIIDALPLPVLLEQTATIAACFPSGSANIADPGPAAGPALLDALLTARLSQNPETPEETTPQTRRRRLLDPAPAEIPAASLLAGLDAANTLLPTTHRAILAQIARRLHAAGTAADVLRFLTECLVPLANRGLDRAARSLAKASSKKFLRLHADVPTLHRAVAKYEMAGAKVPAKQIANLLLHWRNAGKKTKRGRHALLAALAFFGAGAIQFTYLAATHALSSPGAFIAAGFILTGALLTLIAMLLPAPQFPLPHNRPALTPDELAYLRPAAIRHSLKSATRPSI